jgi:polygalacturonase
VIKALHINAIRLRFLSLGLYDFMVGCNPGENITFQFCDEIVRTFFGCSSSPDEVRKLSLFIQKQARDGRKYHKLTEEHGVETLVIIPPSLDPIV